MPPFRQFHVLNTPLSAATYESLGAFLLHHAHSKGAGPLAVDFSNTHIVTMRRHEPQFHRLTAAMDLFMPDGMPLVWVMNRQGAGMRDRVYGPEFTRRFLENAPDSVSHYFLGGSEACGKLMTSRLRAKNPSLRVVGSYHGRCEADGVLADDDSVFDQLETNRPDFIWVGFGAPKQYAWIARAKPRLGRGVFLAVGFAFDAIAGTKPDAPMWMQRRGLTWLFRLLSEPRRLAGRYLTWNTLFLWYLLAHAVLREDCPAET